MVRLLKDVIYDKYTVLRVIFWGIIKLLVFRFSINNYLSALEQLKYRQKIFFFKTLYINFRLLPLKEAKVIPVLIYGKTHFVSLEGKVKVLKDISYGMLKIGIKDPIRSIDNSNTIILNGTLEIADNIVLRQGLKLRIEIKGCLTIWENNYFGDNCTIISDCGITFLKNTRIGNNATFMDTDIHYVLDTLNHSIGNNKIPIKIGESNWIGPWVFCKKGTVTPNYSIIIGPNTVLSKDYSLSNNYSVFAGSPAKVIKEGLRRVNNNMSEVLLNDYYNNHSSTFILSNELNKFCSPHVE